MKRNTAVFYTNATCNLNCRYCSIDKNPALQTIDKILEKSFENPDYYFNQVIKFFYTNHQLPYLLNDKYAKNQDNIQ